MRLYELIVEGYREAEQEFTAAANNDSAGVKKLIQSYKELVNRNQVKGSERNIDFWRKQPDAFNAFKSFVVGKQAVPTSTEIKRKKLPGKAITLREDDDWLIVIPLDKDASCFHGKNSDWCTTKTEHNYFEQYFYSDKVTLVYCLNKKNAGMWAIAAHTDTDEIEMFDQKDEGIKANQFTQQTGLDPHEMVQLALGTTHAPAITGSRDQYALSLKTLSDTWDNYDYSKPVPEIEKLLVATKEMEYCHNYIKSRFYAINGNRSASRNTTPVAIPTSIAYAAMNHTASIITMIDVSKLGENRLAELIKSKGRAVRDLLGIGWRPSQALVDKIVKDTPSYAVRLLENDVHISDDALINILNGVPESNKDIDYADIRSDMANGIVSALIDKHKPISRKVAAAACGADGGIIWVLHSNNIDIDESMVNAAISSGSSKTLATLRSMKIPVSSDMVVIAIKASRGAAALRSYIQSGGKATPEMIDASIDKAPLETIHMMIHANMPVSEDHEYRAMMHCTDPNMSAMILQNMYHKLKTYSPSDRVMRAAMKDGASLSGEELLNHFKSDRRPKSIPDDVLVEIAKSSRDSSQSMLALSESGDIELTEEIKIAMIKSSWDMIFDISDMTGSVSYTAKKTALSQAIGLTQLTQMLSDMEQRGINIPDKLIREVEPIAEQHEANNTDR